MSELLVTNGRVVNEGETRELDILIRDGRIEAIGSDITAPAGARVIDVAGRYVLPGMIDDQVHFREPGMAHEGEIATESSPVQDADTRYKCGLRVTRLKFSSKGYR